MCFLMYMCGKVCFSPGLLCAVDVYCNYASNEYTLWCVFFSSSFFLSIKTKKKNKQRNNNKSNWLGAILVA